MADQVASGHGQWRIGGGTDLVIALAGGLGRDFCVDVRRRAGHVAGTDGLDPSGFHRVVNLFRQLPLGGVACCNGGVVEFVTQRQRIRRSACEQNLVAGHATADLRKAHRILGQTRRVHRIGHRQIGVIGHNLGRFGQCLFEWIGGVIGGFHAGSLRVIVATNLDRRLGNDQWSGSVE